MGNKEVRDILLWRMVQLDEQFWAAVPSDTKFLFRSVRDGADDVRMFGVMHLTRRYQAPAMKPSVVIDEVETILYSLGRPIRLTSMPEQKACFYAPNWIAPVLLTAEFVGDRLQMTAYTGRSLLVSRFRCRIALWIVEQRLPEGVTRVDKRREKSRKAAEKKKSKS